MESNDTSGPSFNEGSYLRWIVFCLSGLCREPKHERGSLHHVWYREADDSRQGWGWDGGDIGISRWIYCPCIPWDSSLSPVSLSNNERFLGANAVRPLQCPWNFLCSDRGLGHKPPGVCKAMQQAHLQKQKLFQRGNSQDTDRIPRVVLPLSASQRSLRPAVRTYWILLEHCKHLSCVCWWLMSAMWVIATNITNTHEHDHVRLQYGEHMCP